MTLKERILRYRVEHNVTQRDFAKAVGLCQNTINKIETDKNVTNFSKMRVEVWLDKNES